MKRKSIIYITLINLLFTSKIRSQEVNEIHSCKYVVAENGLFLRDMPTLSSNILLKIGFGNEVEILSEGDYVDNYTWCQVKYLEQTGFIATEFLSKINLIEDDYRTNCNIWGNIVSYFIAKEIRIDSTIIESTSGDEGFHKCKHYTYNNGLEVKFHTYYESFETEIIIPNSKLTRKQIVNIVTSGYKSCNKLTGEYLRKIFELNYRKQINHLDTFSSISIIKTNGGNTLILRGGPGGGPGLY